MQKFHLQPANELVVCSKVCLEWLCQKQLLQQSSRSQYDHRERYLFLKGLDNAAPL